MNGYDTRNALSHGAFAMIPDWSDENGDAGAPTPLQEKIRNYELHLIQQIYDASMIVEKAKEFEQSQNKESDGQDKEQQLFINYLLTPTRTGYHQSLIGV